MDSPGRYALFYGIFVILLIDMLLDFVTAYYKHGNLVQDSWKIAMHYLYGYFVFDCVAVIMCMLILGLFMCNKIGSRYRSFTICFFYVLF